MPTFLNEKYQLGRTLGSGVSCKVKLAKDNDNHRYAVKIMNKDVDFEELMSTELQVLKQLSHPNIINFVESGKGIQENPKKGSKEVNYIVLELAQGGELFDFIALGGRFSEPVGRLYAHQLCEALDFMHKAGICHRDLKPENLMLDANYNLKIADFGFAAPVAGRDGKGKLKTQLGTASYMAPEIHLGKPYEGPAVDILASGIILFVMLTQRPPFNQASPDDPHYRLLIGKRADLFWQAHEEAEGEDIYSSDFKNLFEGMVAFNPKERFTMKQILSHPWFKKETSTIAKIKADFDQRKAIVDKEAHNQREEKRTDREKRKAGKEKGTMRGDLTLDPLVEQDERKERRKQWGQLEVKDFDPVLDRQTTQFFTKMEKISVFEELQDYFNAVRFKFESDAEFEARKPVRMEIDSTKLQLKYWYDVTAETEDYGEETKQEQSSYFYTLQVKVRILKVDESTHCVDFVLKNCTFKDSQEEITIEVRESFIQHFLEVISNQNIKNLIDAHISE